MKNFLGREGEMDDESLIALEYDGGAGARYQMRREIQSRRRHFFNKRVSIVNYVSPEAKAEEMLVDESATARTFLDPRSPAARAPGGNDHRKRRLDSPVRAGQNR